MHHTLSDLRKKTDDEINNIVAEVVMGWYWGEGLGSKCWMEGPTPESGNFVWAKRVMSGFDYDWDPVGDGLYLRFVIERMYDKYDTNIPELLQTVRKVLDMGIFKSDEFEEMPYCKEACILSIIIAQEEQKI